MPYADGYSFATLNVHLQDTSAVPQVAQTISFATLSPYANLSAVSAVTDIYGNASITINSTVIGTIIVDASFSTLAPISNTLIFHDGALDSDNDGLTNAQEYAAGTNPFDNDTDRDGFSDFEELNWVPIPTNPLDAASRPTPTVVGGLLDTYSGTISTLWQYGIPTSGVNATAQITADPYVWATNTTGNFGVDERAFLYLPQLDLTLAAQPTLSMRLWSNAYIADGTNIEAYDPVTSSWATINPYSTMVPYNTTSIPVVANGWGDVGAPVTGAQAYQLTAFDLTPFNGATLQLRIAFRSNNNGFVAGTYIDEIRLDDENIDADFDGIFGIIAEFNAGSDPFLADTDGDGFHDKVEILNGSRPRDPNVTPVVFTTTSTLLTGIQATSLAVFNMNQDVYTDILLGTLAGDLYTYAGNGIGSFNPVPVVFNSGATGMNQFATGLVNQDLYTDIVMPSDVNGNVVVMYNDGLGVFSPYTFAIDPYTVPKSVAITDLNNDGYSDILIPNFGLAGAGNTISNLRGTGGKTFTLDPYGTTTGVVAGLYAITTADFNQDGLVDAAITGQGSNTVTVINNSAVAQTSINFTVGVSPEHITTGDLNNDGLIDIIISNRNSASVSILFGDPQLGFTAPVGFGLPVGTETPLGLAIGDVDGDFTPDILVADPTTSQIFLLKSDGLGGISSISSYPIGNPPIDVKLVDVNGDGKLDIVTINQGTLDTTVILNTLILPPLF